MHIFDAGAARLAVMHISDVGAAGYAVMRFGSIKVLRRGQSHHIRLGDGGWGRTSRPFIAATRRAKREKRMPDKTPFSSREITV